MGHSPFPYCLECNLRLLNAPYSATSTEKQLLAWESPMKRWRIVKVSWSHNVPFNSVPWHEA